LQLEVVTLLSGWNEVGLQMISMHCEFHVVVGSLPLWLYLYFLFPFEIIGVNTALYECILLS